jgi:hypothetical protein
MRNAIRNLTLFHQILACFERRDDLARLIKWAERKRLRGPRDAYVDRLFDEETRLMRHHLNSPRNYSVARFVHNTKRFFAPPRTYYRGSAAKYRAANY